MSQSSSGNKLIRLATPATRLRVPRAGGGVRPDMARACRRRRERGHRGRRRSRGDQIVMVAIVGGVGLAVTLGMLSVAMDGLDTIVPGKGGGYPASVGLGIALVVDLFCAAIIWAILRPAKRGGSRGA